MINFFANQKRMVAIEGKGQEGMVFSRSGRSSSLFKMNNVYEALLDDNSQVTDGDIVTDGEDKYFIVGIRQGFRAAQARLYKANATIDVIRIVKHFTNGTHDGFAESLVVTLPAMQETVTANMKVYDAGLLPNTVKRIVIPICGVQLLDRIKIGSDKFQVDAIDDTTYSGLLSIQCSIDKRVTK